MKAMVCEMCQSNDLVKQDGMYVCQYCGTKYTVEEARKLMIEGVVKIDSSDDIKNLYELARRAKESNNSQDAAKFYSMILIKEPSSWEPVFFSVYFSAMSCKIAEIRSASEHMKNIIPTTLELIKAIENPSVRVAAYREIGQYSIAISKMLFIAAQNHYNSIAESIRQNYRQELYKNQAAASLIELKFYGETIRLFSEDKDVMSPYGCEFLKTFLSECEFPANETIYIHAIQQYEPDFQIPQKEKSTHNSSAKSGCYVATAVYGSYDCPQVWTLRRFRDNTLAATWYGRLFIHSYYAISPTMVKWFGKTEWFKNIFKPKLDKLVMRLNGNGVENTPYIDREW